MQSFESCDENALSQIKGVFTDIDDTLTNEGRLTAKAYTAMEMLQSHGIIVVPITGRPAGWCDLIARMWPVDGVVGENGAFYFRYDEENKRMIRHFADPADKRAENRAKLKDVEAKVLAEIPGVGISADQAYRETDLAVDFCEDVPALPSSSVDQIVDIMHDAGMTAKVSSIHVNGWYGTYDKMTMTRAFMKDCFDVDLNELERNYLFTGDSPNDGPMFGYFTNSVGVANVRDFEGHFPKPPKFVTNGRGGDGFFEVVEAIIKAKTK